MLADLVSAFAHFAGLDNGAGHWYLWWSGLFGNLAIFGGVFVAARRLNCHATRCWRLGRHRVEGTPYTTCRRHHPTVPTSGVSLSDIHAAHAAAARGGTDGATTRQ